MTGLRRALSGLGIAGVALGAVTVALILTSDHAEEPWISTPLVVLAGGSFLFTGLYAWGRRPENRIGALMAATGGALFLSAFSLADSPALHSIGFLVAIVPYALLIQVLLAFPSGRVHGRLPVFLVGLAWFAATVMQLAVTLVFDTSRLECSCPENVFMVTRADGVADALIGLQSAVGLGGVLALTVLLIRRWRDTPPAQRARRAPVLLAGIGTMIALFLSLAADFVPFVDGPAEDAVDITGSILFALVPFGFAAGLVRQRLTRAESVSALVERLSAVGRTRGRALRDALAEALQEPGLRLAYCVGEDRYVHLDGTPVPRDSGLAWTPVEVDGRTVGALLHSPQLAEDDPEAVRAVAAAAGLAMENERLQAALRARIEELRESRSRLVQAGDRERRRLERDLHDGAQQRLVALSLNLRLARSRVTDPDAAALLDESIAELAQATDELRELARGIHPAVLADRGLGPALMALAERAAVPVELSAVLEERLPAPVESAAYFLVAEALTNVARYAHAHQAEVRVERQDGALVVEVSDDGVGGADITAGTGLRGLADRLAALDGRLTVHSPAGAGTLVRGVIPVEDRLPEPRGTAALTGAARP